MKSTCQSPLCRPPRTSPRRFESCKAALLEFDLGRDLVRDQIVNQNAAGGELSDRVHETPDTAWVASGDDRKRYQGCFPGTAFTSASELVGHKLVGMKIEANRRKRGESRTAAEWSASRARCCLPPKRSASGLQRCWESAQRLRKQFPRARSSPAPGRGPNAAALFR